MPSLAASRRAAALSPIARIADGGGPTDRIPAASTASANSAFSARNPKPGWRASAPAARAAATTATGSSRSRPCGPSVTGMTAPMPSRSQVRVTRRAISPRFAMKTVRMDVGRVAASMRSPCGAANASIASNSDTPSPTDTTGRKSPVRDPALDGSGRRPSRLATSCGLSSSGIVS